MPTSAAPSAAQPTVIHTPVSWRGTAMVRKTIAMGSAKMAISVGVEGRRMAAKAISA